MLKLDIIFNFIICTISLSALAFIMLFTIINTKSYGKFVLHRYPYANITPLKQDVTALQLTESIMNSFQYFGMFEKGQVIATSNGNLNEKTVVDLFSANEKYTQVVMGIQQCCVLVSKSSFLDSQKQFFQNWQYPTQNVQLGQFVSLNDSENSIINSISLVYKNSSFNDLEKIKHKLCFIIGALQTKQKHSRYLSKQIISIVQEKQQFKKVLKEKCAFYSKDTNCVYEQFKIKMIYNEIQSEADRILKKIPLFQFLQKIYLSWDKDIKFKSQNQEDQFIECLNGTDLQVPQLKQSKNEIKNIQNKTIITVPLKFNSLPNAFYPSDRIDYIYERLLSNNSKSLKKVMVSQCQISKENVYHTINFLLKNNLATDVYPLDMEKNYSLYTLKQIPDKKVIQKFNQLFDQNIFQFLKKFDKYHRIKVLQEKVMYLILNKIIKQIFIFVQKLEPVFKYKPQLVTQTSGFRQNQIQIHKRNVQIDNILNKYAMKPVDLNLILSRQSRIKMGQLIAFVKHNPSQWKFIFVEKD